jgi:hypothetical protein
MSFIWYLLALFSVSVIITVLGVTSLPPIGGAVPQGQNPDEFQKQQIREAVNSKSFAMIMVGIGMFWLTIVGLIVRNYYEDKTVPIQPTVPEPIQPTVPTVQEKEIDIKVPLKSILKKPEYSYPPPYDKVKIYPY